LQITRILTIVACDAAKRRSNMYARVTTSQVDPSKAEEVEAIMEDIVLPILRRQKGFKSYISFVKLNQLWKTMR
jgi:hypothetical protein